MIKRFVRKLKKITNNNRGTTILEMIVCFLLLGIFLAASAAFIAHITMLYYNTKGEINGREVSDIILEKIASEIDGAETFDKCGVMDPAFINAEYSNGTDVFYKENGLDSTIPVKALELYDKTDTHVSINFDPEKEGIRIHYYAINDKDDTKDRNKTDWYFDESVYNGYAVKDLIIIPANDMSNVQSGDKDFSLANYGLTAADSSYPSNVMVILLHINHPNYNDYYTYRFVKMYNVPDDYEWGGSNTNP